MWMLVTAHSADKLVPRVFSNRHRNRASPVTVSGITTRRHCPLKSDAKYRDSALPYHIDGLMVVYGLQICSTGVHDWPLLVEYSAATTHVAVVAVHPRFRSNCKKLPLLSCKSCVVRVWAPLEPLKCMAWRLTHWLSMTPLGANTNEFGSDIWLLNWMLSMTEGLTAVAGPTYTLSMFC